MASSFGIIPVMPKIDALLSTGASLDTLVEVTAGDCSIDWKFWSINKTVPSRGSIVVLKDGSLARVAWVFFRWIFLELPSGNTKFVYFQAEKFGSACIEPTEKYLITYPPLAAVFLLIVSRFFILLLVDRLEVFATKKFVIDPFEVWVLVGVIIMTATYIALSIIHRSQWDKLSSALFEITPDWLPRLSKDVGGFGTGITFFVLLVAIFIVFDLSFLTLFFGFGFLFLDLMPSRNLPAALPLCAQCKVPIPRKDKEIESVLRRLLICASDVPIVLNSNEPERLLLSAEALVENGVELSVLGPEPEFLPGTVRDNFAWEKSEVADNHFKILMEYVGLDKWRNRFGTDLNYQIGSHGQGLAASEAARLAIARALAQGARRLILIDALSPLSSSDQWKLCERLTALGCRIVIFSSMADSFKTQGIKVG